MIKNIKKIVLLDKEGKMLNSFAKKETISTDSSCVLPVVIESYLWNEKDQNNSAEKYKDQIKRVFYPDKVEKNVKNMLQDDLRRIELIESFNYGKKVLEVGCSDGSVSIKIAQIPNVSKVVGIDIRKSAIKDGKRLIKDLLKQGIINYGVAKKIKLENFTIENFPLRFGKFDSVCAYEVFEHMAPQDMLPAFQNLYKFIKKDGKFFISVPNRFPNKKYEKMGRARWHWFDHRNYFSKISLEIFLSNFFNDIKVHSLYEEEDSKDSIYLIFECNGKKYE
ncbi:MAG: class I SAM-dependent methyltransferase [Parcubacteria group bacterium]|jgi:SAM-dependent methyltransferase